MNDRGICKQCIYYDDFCCHNNKVICINNSEYRDAEIVIKSIEREVNGNENNK